MKSINGYVHLTFISICTAQNHTLIHFSLTQVPSVLWAPKQWGSHGEETRDPQGHDPGGGNRKSIQGE